MKITLTNDFHGTSVNLRIEGSFLSDGQVRKSWRALCGSKDCNCSNITGMRGPQTAPIVGCESYKGGLGPRFSTLCNLAEKSK